jgi:acyl dehydratase
LSDKPIFFEDFVAGQRLDYGSRSVSQDDIVRFAREFDPQPFHTDPVAAETSIYGGLIASGWHTCAIMMRILCDGVIGAAASLGSPGIDELRWLKPVRPGDTLSVYGTVLEVRPSKSKPDRGVVVSKTEVLNQAGDIVLTLRAINMYRKRPAP